MLINVFNNSFASLGKISIAKMIFNYDSYIILIDSTFKPSDLVAWIHFLFNKIFDSDLSNIKV